MARFQGNGLQKIRFSRNQLAKMYFRYRIFDVDQFPGGVAIQVDHLNISSTSYIGKRRLEPGKTKKCRDK
ncbi:MAG: hypothetical protein IPJ40_12585 [Saprospirales bacterium]|nr:hypothetical protein [Saprospirales bacterium]